MKKIAIVFAALVIGCAAAGAKDIKKLYLTTDPLLHCENCEIRVKKFLKYEPGVKSVDIDRNVQCVEITYDAEKTSEKALLSTFSKNSFKTKVLKGKPSKRVADNHQCTGSGDCDDAKHTAK